MTPISCRIRRAIGTVTRTRSRRFRQATPTICERRSAGTTSRKRALKDGVLQLVDRILGGPVPRADLRPDDVIVIPEWLIGRAPDAFSSHRRILLTQGPYILLQGLANAPPALLSGFDAHVSVSRLCDRALAYLGAENRFLVPPTVATDRFAYQQEKSFALAYMPRRRGGEAQTLISLLRSRGRVGNLDFVPIDGKTPDQVAETLRDSLFFLAFSEQEGFGLPPAEAMASGCVVIGYHGYGGAEYFDDTTGIPVADGDLFGFLMAVEDAVAAYRRDPEPLDRLRAQAAARMAENYALKNTKGALADAWNRIDRQFSGG